MGAVTADPAVGDRAIAGEGTPEADWTAWPGLARVATIDLDTLVPHGKRAVIVAPHPDDEILASGGLLALLAARGTAVSVVSVTDGDASHPGSTQWPPQRLAAERRNESAEGLRHLGVPPRGHLRLGLPDGAVAAHATQLRDALAASLEPGDAVFSTWVHDGHPDHEATALAVSAACARRGCPHWQQPVWMWHWAAPGDARVPWTRLRRLPLSAQAQARKRAAIDAHATQLAPQDTGAAAVLPAWAMARLLRADEYVFIP